MLGAALLALEGERRERPAGRLPDADRQPRGRDPARALGAARGRRRGLRGHAPHAHRCSTATAYGQARVATTSTTRSARARSWWSGCAAGDTVALVSDAGMPLVSDPGYVLVRACVAAGLAVEVLPGPSAAIAALVASALPADRWRFAGLPAAQEGRAARAARRSRAGRWWRSSRRGACRPRWPLLAELDPERAVAVCRELTKVHEEVVRGSAGRAGRALRGRAAAGRGGARARRRRREPAAGGGRRGGLDALRRLVEAGAKPRDGGGGGGRAHRRRAPTRSTARSPSDDPPHP